MLDKEELKQRVNIVNLIGQDVDLSHRANGEYVGCCPFHEEQTGSLSVSYSLQKFNCFGCNAHGDIIDYVMRRDGVPFPQALQTIGEFSLFQPYSPKATSPQRKKSSPKRELTPLPVPDDAWTRAVNFSFQIKISSDKIIWRKADHLYKYVDSAGKFFGFHCRINSFTDGAGVTHGKEFRPLTYGKRNNKIDWHCVGPEGTIPLYNLSTVEESTCPILVLEGEKCVEAVMERLVQDYGKRSDLYPFVPLTWMGGAHRVKKADWSTLAERPIIIWPDCDTAGDSTITHITTYLPQSKIMVVPDGKPKGWDVADFFEAEGMNINSEELWKFIEKNLKK